MTPRHRVKGRNFSVAALTRDFRRLARSVGAVNTLAFMIVRQLLRLVRLGPSPEANGVEIAVLRHQLTVLRHQLTVLRHQLTVLRRQVAWP